MKKRQFTGIPFEGIIYQAAQRVNAPERGVSFNRPNRYVLSTPVGQVEISIGDWVIYMPSGLYVIKDADIFALSGASSRKWWQIW